MVDKRKQWYYDAKANKSAKKAKRRPAQQYRPIEEWSGSLQRGYFSGTTQTYGDPHDLRIEAFLHRLGGIRERNELFADELIELRDRDGRLNAYQQQSRTNRRNYIIHEVLQNNNLLDEVQNEIDEINEEYDDVSSHPRR